MITHHNASASQAIGYYLNLDSIFAELGKWQGKGAEILELNDSVNAPEFIAVITGIDPRK